MMVLMTSSIGISSEMLENTSFSRPDSWCITPLALHGSVELSIETNYLILNLLYGFEGGT